MNHEARMDAGERGGTRPERVFRFAPSPNGPLHLGHAYSALMNQKLATACAGRLLLRMENIDLDRCSPALESAIERDLAWLGVAWTPPILRQSDHFACYRANLARLQARDLLYPCFCTRGDIARAIQGKLDWPLDPDGSPLYPGTCRHLTDKERGRRSEAGRPAAQRLDRTRAAAVVAADLSWCEKGEDPGPGTVAVATAPWGDVLLARKDIATSYHLAVVTDDAAQGVTDVVRGSDLFAATSLHRLLQALLGFPAPTYHHHRLIRDPAGAKLAKSAGALSLQSMREAGTSATDIRRQLGFAGP